MELVDLLDIAENNTFASAEISRLFDFFIVFENIHVALDARRPVGKRSEKAAAYLDDQG